MKTKIDNIKLIKRLVLVLFCIILIGLFIANRIVKNYGYSSVFEVVTTYSNNTNLANDIEPLELKINLSKANFDFIKNKRQIALDRGLIINKGDSYVDCDLKLNNTKIKAKLRLKGHMTDHLQGDKWSFRIKAKDTIMGMYRFSLQHPGTRNYVYEWIYHQLLKNEEVIYLKYDFINVQLNENNLGIYAVEEHFGQHVLDRNNRPKGAIIRWNPNLYWEGRIDEYQENHLNQDYSSYSSSFPEPYDKSTVIKDKEILENYKIAAKKLEEFRRGELLTSEVFDVDKMAKFHAVIDLVGGQHSLDWSDVKFYYNSETKYIEPVGYESFSIRETHEIAGQQLIDSYEGLQFNYHAQLFSDPIFFKAYIKNLERIASQSYVNDFYNKIEKELNQKIGVISKEWAFRKFSFDGYYKNVRLIQHNLALPKALHAFTKTHCKDSMVISLAPVSDFPIEIIGVKQKNNTIKTIPFILKAKARKTIINYFDLTFYGDFEKINNVIVLAKIPGSSNVFEIELAKYPAYKFEEVIDEKPILIDTSLFLVNGSKIIFKNNINTINSKQVIPKGFELSIYPNQKIILNNQLIINGELRSHGFKSDNILIATNKNGILIINNKFTASNTSFTGVNCIRGNSALLSFYNCKFYDITKSFLTSHNSIVSLKNCFSGTVNQLLVSNDSKLDILNCKFNNGEVLFNNNGSYTVCRDLEVNNYNTLAILNYQSMLNSYRVKINNVKKIYDLKNSSCINSIGDSYSGFNIGFVLNKNSKNLVGNSSYSLYKTNTTNFKILEKHI